MPNIVRNFIAGKMNKDVDERLVPNGEYIDAMNIRLNSTEASEKGVIENAIGNIEIVDLRYRNTQLSTAARTIGVATDGARENIYWFVHDPNFVTSPTGKVDMIVSYNTLSNTLTYHIVSVNDGSGVNTVLNFSHDYLITGINIVDELLFFTDDLNPPRVINVKRTYAQPTVGNLDVIQGSDIQVLKAPPSVAIKVTPLRVLAEDNFMEERFICFGYRYRYEDNEYSATTPFTNPIFVADIFNYSGTSFLNEGMVNVFNAALVEFNTGDSTVVGIDVLFKEAGSNIIRVIQKIDKQNNLPDNVAEKITFSNQKIFTILPESELLRLYDNVPRLAKAQTIMGNRIHYGNYLEGYDLVTQEGTPIELDYTVALLSEEIGSNDIPTVFSPGTYAFGGGNTGNANNLILINLFDVKDDLKEGALLSIEFSFEHAFFNAAASSPTDQTGNIDLALTFVLPRDYASVFELAEDPAFQEVVGLANIQTVANACNGLTFTDQFNCAIPNTLNNFVKTRSGVNAADEPILILANPAVSAFVLQLPAMEFIDSITTDSAFEFYRITTAVVDFQKIGNTASLHSNRGYEVGIVYMDDFKRSTTVLTSPNNNLYVPCEASITQNKIQVTIPDTQKPPEWAKTYKFAIKSDREGYEVVYSSFFVRDKGNFAYFLLDGENSRKVEVGDRLFVKRDSSGPTRRCVTVTVLEKEAKETDFLGNTNPSFSGVYIKLSISEINAVIDEDSIIDPGNLRTFSNTPQSFTWPAGYPIAVYPCNIPDPANPGNFVDYTIPGGSRIVISYEFSRLGRRSGDGACERRTYTLKKTLISTGEYSSFDAWFVGDNIDKVIQEGVSFVGGGGSGQIFNTFIPAITNTLGDIPFALTVNYWRFHRDLVTNALSLMTTGTKRCSGNAYPRDKTRSEINARIQVFRADNTLIFETQPQDALPDVYLEGTQIFDIDSLHQHEGNVQNQDYALSLPAIIDLNFQNCYSFGNGAESYKIRDSIIGRQFNLGNRALSVAAQDFKAARRFADLTYSGVYNDETNVNKFNEFNLGLLNFKQLERYFGPIMLLDGRETNIRVMQEDKISYVLAGKDLLSDAGAGNALVSVPEVLGTQIARIEEYGISFNPESFAKWGDSAFFTDAKRGAVLQLKGGGSPNEQLVPISDTGMGSWFRDLFIEKFGTQKLGGFDPYMKEYVLVGNDRFLPTEEDCDSCGQSKTYKVEEGEDVVFCVFMGNPVGLSSVVYNIVSSPALIEVIITYNSVDYSSGEVSASGVFEFPKNEIIPSKATVRLKSVTGSATVEIRVNCPVPDIITIVQVTIGNNTDVGKSIHNQYSYTKAPFAGSTQSNPVQLLSGSDNPLISDYTTITGAQGLGAIPVDGATVRMISNRIGFDDFVFKPLQHNFRYLRSNTLYVSTPADIQTLLGLINTATPITGSGNIFQSEFTMPGGGSYLYLLWDYRESFEQEICFDAVNTRALCCCGCQP